MLASPRYPLPQSPFSPQHSTSDDSRQYRPSRDLEAFNSLLPPPIEFVEGSSSDSLAVAQGKYEPINASPKAIKVERSENVKATPATPSTPHTPPAAKSATPTSSAKSHSLYNGDIELSWPKIFNLGSGLYNTGNTCFLNSALQCLLHTPPLLHLLLQHTQANCRTNNSFCMSCALRTVAGSAHKSKSPFSPSVITGKLQLIAKNMRRGRQEDSHEFLRYAVDALQKSCLAGYPPKIDHKLAETTWVHKVFGGQLRSRVTCGSCGYHSDTFDSILDLSLDIYNSHTLKEALRKFVAPDHLKGADKYKCDKCKKHVNAEKRFTIHEAPVVLTVHLKRFSPMGHKIGHQVAYEEHLSLETYMSEGQYGPSYSLYGVICHAGGGPHSGHYYAYVKSRENKWYEMNDETVTVASTPTRIKNGYILFYIQNKGQKLESAVKSSSLMFTPTPKPGINLIAAMKKKRLREENEAAEDQGVKLNGNGNKPFIGPVLPTDIPDGSPSSPKRAKLSDQDPQASAIKKKIEARKSTSTALSSLAATYNSDDDDAPAEESSRKVPSEPASAPVESPSPSSPHLNSTPSSKSTSAIPPSSFYATPAGAKTKTPSRSGLSSAIRPLLNKQSGFTPYGKFGGKAGGFRKRPRGL